jgi:RsmE family RNA methyltransferase
VEKLAELGLGGFQPAHTERVRWQIPDRRRDRWRRLAVAALQQSCGAWLLRLEPERSLADLTLGLEVAGAGWLADPEGSGPGAGAGMIGGVWVGIVGPSSGLTVGERRSLIDRGVRPICLAQRRLRTETAALALASAWATASAAGTGWARTPRRI